MVCKHDDVDGGGHGNAHGVDAHVEMVGFASNLDFYIPEEGFLEFHCGGEKIPNLFR